MHFKLFQLTPNIQVGKPYCLYSFAIPFVVPPPSLSVWQLIHFGGFPLCSELQSDFSNQRRLFRWELFFCGFIQCSIVNWITLYTLACLYEFTLHNWFQYAIINICTALFYGFNFTIFKIIHLLIEVINIIERSQ